MKSVPWFVACVIAGCAAVEGALPAVAQTPPPNLPAAPPDKRRVTLAEAVVTAYFFLGQIGMTWESKSCMR